MVVYLKAPGGDSSVIEEAYRQISWSTGEIPGLLRSELLRDVDEPDRFALFGEWDSLESYRTWQFSPDHVDKPSALRPYQDRDNGRHYVVYGMSAQ